VRLAGRREHAGGDGGRPFPARVVHGDVEAALGAAPGDGEPDQPSAHDSHPHDRHNFREVVTIMACASPRRSCAVAAPGAPAAPTAPTTATPYAPARTSSAPPATVTPPIAITGTATSAATAATPSGPIGSGRPSLVAVA